MQPLTSARPIDDEVALYWDYEMRDLRASDVAHWVVKTFRHSVKIRNENSLRDLENTLFIRLSKLAENLQCVVQDNAFGSVMNELNDKWDDAINSAYKKQIDGHLTFLNTEHSLLMSPWKMDSPVTMGEVMVVGSVLDDLIGQLPITVGQLATVISKGRRQFIATYVGASLTIPEKPLLLEGLFGNKGWTVQQRFRHETLFALNKEFLRTKQNADNMLLWMWLAPSFCSTAHLPYPRVDGEAEEVASAAVKLEVLAQELGIDLVAQYMAVGAVDDQTIREAIKNDIDPALLSSMLGA